MQLLHDSGFGLADVEGVAVRRVAVHVMEHLVAVSDLHRLPDLRPDDPRHVHAGALIDRHGLRRNRRRRETIPAG